MKIKRGSTSVRRLIFIADSSSTTGAGLASLTYNSSGLVAYYFAGDLSNEVAITLATATLGTYTSGGFVAVDNTNMPGWYEIGIPDAALDGGNECAIQLRGATNMVPVNIYIELDAFDYQTATQPVNVTQFGGTNGTFSSGRPEVNTTHFGGTSQTARDIGASVLLSSGTGTGQVSLSSGTVTVGTNNDKTGYSLTQSFPTHFADMQIAANGHVSSVVESMANNSITASAIQGDAITAAKISADAVTEIQSGLSTLTAAQVNAEVVDALSTDTYAELSAPPAATSSLKDKITYVFQWLRNKSTQTSSQRKLYADDGTTVVATETISDDNTTYTKGEAS